jgi:hypothetical protein
VNLFNKDNASNILKAYISGNTIVSGDVMCTVFVKCRPSTQYTISKKAGQRFTVAYTKELPDIGVSVYGYITASTADHITITTGPDAKYIVAFIYNGNVDSSTVNEMLESVQIAEGADVTYHRYTGNTVPVAEATTLETLSGVNNVFADVGDVTVGYKYMPMPETPTNSNRLLLSSVNSDIIKEKSEIKEQSDIIEDIERGEENE